MKTRDLIAAAKAAAAEETTIASQKRENVDALKAMLQAVTERLERHTDPMHVAVSLHWLDIPAGLALAYPGPPTEYVRRARHLIAGIDNET